MTQQGRSGYKKLVLAADLGGTQWYERSSRRRVEV